MILLVACVGASLLVPAAASAASVDPGGFRLSSRTLFVHENAGAAVITVERTDTSREAQIRYLAWPITAVRSADFTPVKGMIDFLPGQSSATFTVPIVDHGLPGPPKTVKIVLFGASPIGLGIPSKAVLTIINDDVVSLARNPLNPLGLPVAPPPGDPLTGARFFIDHTWGKAALAAKAWRFSHPSWAKQLGVIANEPETHRFGNWGPHVEQDASAYFERAAIEEPGTVPMIATYYLVDGHCGHYSDPSWRQAAYHRWIGGLAAGIGDYRGILFLEMDSLITVGCLSPHGVAVRMAELRDAINVLTAHCPRLVIYLDAGAADAVHANVIAKLLRRAGVQKIQGFFLNSTHFDWTSREIRFGEQVSRLTGGKHFVVNTAENGRGPLVPPDPAKNGAEVLCGPAGRGLGPKPTFNTGYPNVDAFAWIAIPGMSPGPCVPGAPPPGQYWPQLALELIRNADFKVR